MVTCQRCGYRENDGRFCVNCGTPIAPTPASPALTVPTQPPVPAPQPVPGYPAAVAPARPQPRLGRNLLLGVGVLALLLLVGGLGAQWYMGRPARGLADRFLAELQQDPQRACALVNRHLCVDRIPSFEGKAGQLKSFQYEGISWAEPLDYTITYSYRGTKQSGRITIRVINDGSPRIYAVEAD